MTAETEERIIEGLATINEQLKQFATKVDIATINEQLKHFATKEDVALTRLEVEKVRADLEKALREQLKWIILLHVPTWMGIVGLLLKH
jgi:C4-dicarboxylate-specific signal transduction histidine kinase